MHLLWPLACGCLLLLVAAAVVGGAPGRKRTQLSPWTPTGPFSTRLASFCPATPAKRGQRS